METAKTLLESKTCAIFFSFCSEIVEKELLQKTCHRSQRRFNCKPFWWCLATFYDCGVNVTLPLLSWRSKIFQKQINFSQYLSSFILWLAPVPFAYRTRLSDRRVSQRVMKIDLLLTCTCFFTWIIIEGVKNFATETLVRKVRFSSENISPLRKPMSLK